MKPILHYRFLIFLLGPLFAGASLNAQLIFADSFNYPDGQIVGAPGSPWTNNYPPSNQTSIASGRLVLTQSNLESVRVDFSSVNSGRLYAGMVVNLSQLPTGSGNFFAFFRVAGIDNLRARIWVSTNGAAPGRFRLGITTIFFPPTLIPQDLELGQDYTVVSRYEITNSHSTLWLNPAGESDVLNRVDDFTDVGSSSIGHFGFAQTPFFQTNSGNYIGALTVDELRVGRTFGAVQPVARFTSIGRPVNGAVNMAAIGPATTNYILQASTNLSISNWVTLLATNAGTNGPFSVADPAATNFPVRFYRLIKQ